MDVKQDQQLTTAPNIEIDTNAEYISAKGIHDQPPIITSVFRSIFIEIPKEFYFGIKNFFLRYTTLFKDGFKYLKFPSLKLDPFANKDYKENCQHTFEYALLIVALLIFLIKVEWIYGVEKLKDVYNNDISEALMQFIIFLIFAVAYFLLVLLSVLIGRLSRFIFQLPVTRQECDILFTYLNNIFYILTASAAFLVRCIVPAENVEGNDAVQYIVLSIYALTFGILIFKWATRLALLNNLKKQSVVFFKLGVTTVFALFFGICSTAITFFIWGV